MSTADAPPCGARHALHGVCVLPRSHRSATAKADRTHENATGERWTAGTGRPQKRTTAQIVEALRAHEGNLTAAAKSLGTTRRLLQMRIAREGIGPEVAAMRPAKVPGPVTRARALAAVDRHATALEGLLSTLAGCDEHYQARTRIAVLLAAVVPS